METSRDPLLRLRRLPDRKGWLRPKRTYELEQIWASGEVIRIRDGEQKQDAFIELGRLTHQTDAYDYRSSADRHWDGADGAWCVQFGPDLTWVAEVIDDLVALLERAGGPGVPDSGGFARLSEDLRAVALDPIQQRVERRRRLSTVLALYGGMGSFQDLALPGADGSYAVMDELGRLRDELFRRARLCLQ